MVYVYKDEDVYNKFDKWARAVVSMIPDPYTCNISMRKDEVQIEIVRDEMGDNPEWVFNHFYIISAYSLNYITKAFKHAERTATARCQADGEATWHPDYLKQAFNIKYVDEMENKLKGLVIFTTSELRSDIEHYHLPKSEYLEVILNAERPVLVSTRDTFGNTIKDQCLIELFGRHNIFTATTPYNNTNHNKSLSSGWMRLFKQLDVEYPIESDPYSGDREEFIPVMWTDAKWRLKSLGASFGYQIVQELEEERKEECLACGY